MSRLIHLSEKIIEIGILVILNKLLTTVDKLGEIQSTTVLRSFLGIRTSHVLKPTIKDGAGPINQILLISWSNHIGLDEISGRCEGFGSYGVFSIGHPILLNHRKHQRFVINDDVQNITVVVIKSRNHARVLLLQIEGEQATGRRVGVASKTML